jgi:hypothetical protein
VNLSLDDPFTRAVVETVAVAAATLILLFIVASSDIARRSWWTSMCKWGSR